MKMKKLLYLLTVAVLLVQGGCTFKDSINTDPNNPQVVESPATLLTSAQVGFAYNYGGAFARYGCLFTNQLSGTNAQAIGIDNFNFLNSETDDSWDNAYRALKTLDDMVNKSAGSPHYQGVGKIMKALVLGTLAENFGACPYSTALAGKEDGSGLQPTYDSGPQNYTDIQALLDAGIEEVGAATSILSPTSNDNIFGGDLAQWAKFGHALKARYYLHTAKVNAGDYNKALAAALQAQGVTAALQFAGTSVGSQNPLFQFSDQRGDVSTGRLLTDSLKAYADPRALVYVSDTGGYGSNPGAQDGSNSDGSDFVYPLVNPNDKVYFVNSAEPFFIAAEIQARNNELGDAAQSYNKGVLASLKERGLTDTVLTPTDNADDSLRKQYIAAFIKTRTNENGGTITLGKILLQKYLAMYLNQETFADWRRTGFPATRLPANNITGGVYVRKYPYPQKERTLNGANVPDERNPPATSKVWWDVP